MEAQPHLYPRCSCIEFVAGAVPTKALHHSQLRFDTPTSDGFRRPLYCKETMHRTLSVICL